MEPSGTGPVIRRTLFDGFTFGYLCSVFFIEVFQSPLMKLKNLEDLERSFGIFALLWFIGAGVSIGLNKVGMKTLGEVLFAPPHRRMPNAAPRAWYRTFAGWHAFVTVAVSLLFSFVAVKFSLQALLDIENVQSAGKLFSQLFSPDWKVLPNAVYSMIETLYLAFLATAIAVPVAFVLSFLSAKNIMGTTPLGAAIYGFFRACFNLSRSIEPLIWAIIFSVWVGIGPFAGMLALMIHSISSLAKQYSEFVEGVDDGPIEGIRSTGANTLQTVWFAIVPQVTLPYISYTIYRWDTNVRMATVIGLVGGGGIGNLLIQYQGQAMWPQVGCIILVIAAVVWIMDAFSAYVREALK